MCDFAVNSSECSIPMFESWLFRGIVERLRDFAVYSSEVSIPKLSHTLFHFSDFFFAQSRSKVILVAKVVYRWSRSSTQKISLPITFRDLCTHCFLLTPSPRPTAHYTVVEQKNNPNHNKWQCERSEQKSLNNFIFFSVLDTRKIVRFW